MATSAMHDFSPHNVHLSWVVLAALPICVLLNFVISTFRDERPYRGIPVISLPNIDPKTGWFKQGRAIVFEGLKTGSPFQVITGTGPKIVLPNRFADDIKKHPELSLEDAFDKEFFFNYPGFEGFAHNKKESGFIPELVRTKLTASLGLIMNDLVDETTCSIHDIFGEDDQWHSVVVKQRVLDLIARLSSRVFLGLPLCRNKRWLEISKEYTVDAVGGARVLRATPSLLRPVLHFFLPQMRQLRKHVRDAEKLIRPEVETRRARAIQTLEKGHKPPKTADTIGWMVEMCQGRREEVNYVAAQLSLSMAAIHTTSEAVAVALLDLCLHSEVAKALREEIIEVIGADGWSKKALVNMKRLDSFLKESQRFHLSNAVSMNRLVKEQVELSDGSIIPANSCIMVANANMDRSVYSNPETFQPWRFVAEGHWEHVSIQHPSQLSFGYGKHACPGRFFASNEIKIAFSHLLLKYDWKLGSEENPFWKNETQAMVKSDYAIQARRRVEEIELDLDIEVE